MHSYSDDPTSLARSTLRIRVQRRPFPPLAPRLPMLSSCQDHVEHAVVDAILSRNDISPSADTHRRYALAPLPCDHEIPLHLLVEPSLVVHRVLYPRRDNLKFRVQMDQANDDPLSSGGRVTLAIVHRGSSGGHARRNNLAM